MSQEATQDQRQEGGRKRIQLNNMTALGDSDKQKRDLLKVGMPGLVTLLSDLGALSIEGATGSFWFLFWFYSLLLSSSLSSLLPSCKFFCASLCQRVCMYMSVCECDVCIHVCAEARGVGQVSCFITACPIPWKQSLTEPGASLAAS